MADTEHSKCFAREGVRVRIPLPAPRIGKSALTPTGVMPAVPELGRDAGGIARSEPARRPVGCKQGLRPPRVDPPAVAQLVTFSWTVIWLVGLVFRRKFADFGVRVDDQ